MAASDRLEFELDESLGARSVTGDKEAFAELYERYYGAIYDFAVRILRDPDAAADVVQATFASAWPALRKGTRPSSIKAWLFGIARNLSIDELRRRRRVLPNEGLGLGLAELPDPAAHDPSETVETKELAELVWTSAAGLRAEEYALLDLHVRRGLSADELAKSLGVRRGAVYTRLTRLRQALETAVATSLLLRHGRGQCAELDQLVAEHPVQGPVHEGRRVIQTHVEDCVRCQESKGRYASPAQILAGLALVPPPEELGEAVWVIVGGGLAGAAAIAASGKTGVLSGAMSQAPVGVGVAAGGFATLATVLALGGWVVAGGDETTNAATPGSASDAPARAAPLGPAKAGASAPKPRATKRAAPRSRPVAGATDQPRAVQTGFARAARHERDASETSPSVAAPAPVAETPVSNPQPRPRSSPPPAAPPPAVAPPPPAPAPSPQPAPAPPTPPPPPAPSPAPPPAPPPVPPPPPPAGNEKKVVVCFHGNTLIVSIEAVPGLLRAGATLGACSITDDGRPL